MKIHTIQLNIGDFVNGTNEMSATEVGAYIRLIIKHYAVGLGGIPSDPAKLARIAGMSLDKWKNVSENILCKFELGGDFYTQPRVITELKKASAKSTSNRDNALKRHNSSHANASVSHSERNAIQDTRYKIQDTEYKEEVKVSTPPAKAGEVPTPKILYFDFDEFNKISEKALVKWSRQPGMPEEWCPHWIELGWTEEQLVREAYKFSEYWVNGKGNDPRKSVRGWRQTWNNWLTNAEKWRK